MSANNYRILVVTNLSEISHSVRPEFQMFLHWKRWGHAVTVVTPSCSERKEVESEGIRVIESGQTKKICLKTIFLLRKLLKEECYDVVYATDSKSIPSANFAALGIRTKLVVYRGTTSGLYRHDPTSYLTVLHPRVDAIVCVSEAVKSSVLNKVRLPNQQVVAIHKGHELAWYNQPAASLESYAIPQHSFVVIAVANFRPKKGLDVLISAVSKLVDIENLQVLIVGSGANKEPYLSAIQKSPLADRIHCIGFHPEAPRLMAASDVLVQASIAGEGLPRTVIESFAYAVPVISSDVGGAKEIITEGVSGFVVPAGNEEAIADKIRYLYHHEEQRLEMGRAAREVLSRRLGSEMTAKQYLDFFDTLTSSSSGT